MKKDAPSGTPLLGTLWRETRKNWKTILVLVVLFSIGLTLRSVFYYQESVESGVELSGNDPYYHKRVIDYIQDEREHLVRDPLLGYPMNPHNPRPPLFDWSIAVEGLAIGSILGNVGAVSLFITQITPSFWGALTIVPVYFLTKEFFGRKAALWAAFFLAIMPSHIDRSSFGFSDHDSFVLFFVVVTFFFLVKALRSLKPGRWIDNFLSPRSVVKGVRAFAKDNFLSVGYAMMAAMSLSTIALAWKGFSYVIAIIMVFYIVQLVLNAFKHEDSTGIAILILLVLTIPLLLALPAYASMNMIWSPWGLRPVLYIYMAAIALTVAFVATRDVPWIILLPSLAIIGGVSYLTLYQVNPDLAETLISGGGYFVKTKRYSTIAEAQAPILSRLIVSYGPVTFFFGLVGILFATMRFVKHWKTDELFIVIWTVVSIFMAISAVRFMFNAAPAFAILQGWIVFILVKKADFRSIGRSLQGFSGQFWYGLRKGLKVRHVAVTLFMVFMVVMPNAWLAFDASLPYEKKREMDNQIYDSMPEWFRPEKYDPERTLWWFGAFGQGFPSEYWHSFFEWLSEQDTELAMERRPAFLSWWDYGMWCVQIGEHPTVADNFMNGHEMAGNFIASPNETHSISLLVTRILEGRIRHSEGENDATRLAVEHLGEDSAAAFIDAIRNPKRYIDTINDHPERFGNKDGLRVGNARFSYAAYIVERLDEERIVDFLIDAERLTGNWIRYFAVDSRMFPFSYYNTGIFYAPITLSDHAVSDYLKTMVQVGNRLYTPDEFDRLLEIDPDLEPDDLVLSYTSLFFDTMFYNAYIGYSATDIGGNTSMGIPGISGELAVQSPMQGWMMKHYKLVYKSTYWNPFNTSLAKKHSDDWEVITYDEALERQSDANNTGTVDMQTGLVQGVMVLKYYHGALLSGRVMTGNGIGIPGAVVTVYDKYGIPHDLAETDETGRYELVAPSGEVVVRASKGGPFNPLFQTFDDVLVDEEFNITEAQAERLEVDLDGNGRYDYLIEMDLVMNSTYINGTLFWDTDQDGKLDEDEAVLANAEIELNGTNVVSLTTDENGNFSTSDAIAGTYVVFLTHGGNTYDLGERIDSDGEEPTESDVPIKGFLLKGKVRDINGAIGGVEITLKDTGTGEVHMTTTTNKGKYSFEDLLPGTSGSTEYILSVDEPGAIPVLRTVAGQIGKEVEIDIDLQNATVLNGTVTIDQDGDGNPDGPVANALVIATGEGTRVEVNTGEDGVFSLILPAGDYVLTAHMLGPAYPMGGKASAVSPGEVDIVLLPLQCLGGKLYIDNNEDGEFDPELDTPIANAEVIIDGPIHWTGVSNNKGDFAAFLPSGDHHVSAVHRGSGTNVTWLGSAWVEFDDPVSIDVQLERADHVTGTVYWDRDGDEEPSLGEYIDGIELVFTGEEELTVATGTVHNTFTTTTESNGSFEVYLLPGNYTVTSPNFDPLPLPGGSDVMLNLTPRETEFIGRIWADSNFDTLVDPGELAGSGLDASVRNLEDGSSAMIVTTRPDGTFNISLLPGTYEVFANGTDSDDVLFQVGQMFYVPYGHETYEEDLLSFHLFHFVPEYLLNGSSVDPEDFGPGDLVRVTPFGSRGNMSVPNENGTMDWTAGGYLIPGVYDIWVNFGSAAALTTINVSSSGTYMLVLEEGVLYTGDVQTLDREHVSSTNLGDLPMVLVQDDGAMVTEILLFDDLDQEYNFSMLLPRGTFGVDINHTSGKDLYIMDAPLSNGTQVLVRHYRVTGKAYHDENGDGKRGSKEGVEGVRLSFVGSETMNVTTRSKGEYEVFLPYGDDGWYNITMPSSDFVGLDPSSLKVPEGTMNIELMPRNLTVTGTAFIDADLDGEIGIDERIDIVSLAFIQEDGVVTAEAVIDGSDFSIELEPRTYVVHAYSTDHAALFEETIEIGGDRTVDLNLTEAVHVSGTVYYENMTGDIGLPSDNQLENGFTLAGNDVTITVPVDIGKYSVVLPVDKYRVKAKTVVEEYGLTSKYSINKKITFDSSITDIVLARNDDHSVELSWLGETQRAHPGTSVQYTLELHNKGNVLINTVTLKKASAPDNWNVTFGNETTMTVDLTLDQTVLINVTIALDEGSRAGEQNVRIKATPSGDDNDDDSVTLDVNVSSVYDFKLDTIFPDRGITQNGSMSLDFVVVNEGNGKDVYTVDIAEVPDGFAMSVLNISYVPLIDTDDDGMIDTGAVKGFEFFPIFLNITTDEDADGKVSIPVRVTSTTTGMVRTLYLSVQVTEPDLRVLNFSARNANLEDGTLVELFANVTNAGLLPIEDIEFQFFMDGEPIGSMEDLILNGAPLGNGTAALPVEGILDVYLLHNVTGVGDHTFSLKVSAVNLTDLHPPDNRASQDLTVGKVSGGGGSGEGSPLTQILAIVVVISVLLIVYSFYRRKRRW